MINQQATILTSPVVANCQGSNTINTINNTSQISPLRLKSSTTKNIETLTRHPLENNEDEEIDARRLILAKLREMNNDEIQDIIQLLTSKKV
ncbi:8818_t:CDS:2 [Diversispora eburnea]|uniref:8818_t:CDS:1 n=1 Tax=Diversispora eburnea TaxID=1213867 RepID=A0A9N9C6U7_9GLOM|nr:8818_t:CDS:2 [Diversispora eburnea]